jgi:hypothetical protein
MSWHFSENPTLHLNTLILTFAGMILQRHHHHIPRGHHAHERSWLHFHTLLLHLCIHDRQSVHALIDLADEFLFSSPREASVARKENIKVLQRPICGFYIKLFCCLGRVSIPHNAKEVQNIGETGNGKTYRRRRDRWE